MLWTFLQSFSLISNMTSLESGNEMISTAILAIPLIEPLIHIGQLSVTGESMCTN